MPEPLAGSARRARVLRGALLVVPVVAAAAATPGLATRKRADAPGFPEAVGRSIEEGRRVEALPASALAGLAARFESGEAEIGELAALRARWSTARDRRAWELRWPITLQAAGVPKGVAQGIAKAISGRDLDRARVLSEAWHEAWPADPAVGVLRAGVLWAAGHEGAGTLAYRDGLRGSVTFVYHDRELEPWVRHQAAELAGGPPRPYRPGDAPLAASLERNLRDAGVAGRFLLEFLAPGTAPLETPLVPGLLPEGAVAAVVASHRADLDACYAIDRQRRGTPDGRLELRLIVGPTGSVDLCRADQGGTLRSRPLQECVCEAARDWRFPMTEGGGIARTGASLDFPLVRGSKALLTALTDGE